MKKRFYPRHGRIFTVVFFLSLALLTNFSSAVTSKVTHQTTAEDFQKGETENIVVSSKGIIELGRDAKALTGDFNDAWSINSIVTSGGVVYIGTSPNGGVYKYSLGKVTEVYSAEPNKKSIEESPDGNEPNEPNLPADTNTVDKKEYLANEHIFAMAVDISGRLLVGISGKKCALSRLEADQMKTIFEPNDAKYIFAIAVADEGDIYLGTGPEGKIYKLNSFGKEPEVIYDSTDKNILSLVIADDSSVYAGSDTRGLIYKINPKTKTATVLYDSDQDEITAILLADNGALYAAATSAKIVQAQDRFAKQLPLAGRPESKPKGDKNSGKAGTGLKLKIANTNKTEGSKQTGKKPPVRKPAKPGQASHIYKVSPKGFVTDVFSETAVFFALVQQEQELLLGTGNNAQLYTIEPSSEQEAIIYEDEQASQITAIGICGEDVYLGTANPAKLIKMKRTFALEGTYTSDLIDASQPANWGKLQVEAEIPEGCKVMAASRSGNVKDINDPTFSEWTESIEVTEPVQLRCPPGRYCQYKLILKNEDGLKTPTIREVAVASTVPNLEPKVEEVTIDRIGKPDKKGVFKISYKAKDDNSDKLIYKIDFRKTGRDGWIELKDKIGQDNYEWDGKTAEDGRYEIRVTASDERSNTTATKLTGSRVSEPVVVDNTGPSIEKYSIIDDENTTATEPAEITGKKATLKLTIVDKYSAIGRLDYTLDSNDEWISAVPDDLVYDTTEENFTILIDELKIGEHIITVRAGDDVGNTTYKTFEINVVGG